MFRPNELKIYQYNNCNLYLCILIINLITDYSCNLQINII